VVPSRLRAVMSRFRLAVGIQIVYDKTMDDKTKTPPSLLEQFVRDAGAGIPEISNRDMAGVILPNLDYEAQLIAISGLLQRNDEADKRVEAEMKALDEYAGRTTGRRNQRAIGEYGELFYVSIYQGAAHSMAALGMLAPLFESLFFQAFQGIRKEYYGGAIPAGTLRSGIPNPEHFWDCHFVYSGKAKSKTRKDLVLGVIELAEAIGFTPPSDLLPALKALFRYRNKMFHCGFEWPANELANFAKEVADEGWETLFSNAMHGDTPWIFYMTDAFINHCRDLVHRLLEALGKYCHDRHPLAQVPVGPI